MAYYGLSLLIASLLTGVSCDQLAPLDKDVFRLDGSSANVSYKSSKQATTDYFFWYRQYPGKAPEFLISHTGNGAKLLNPVSGLSFNVSEDKTRMDLLISSAAVTDSAVYYCAVRPTVTGNTRTLYKNLQFSTAATRGPHSLLIHWLLSLWTEDNRDMKQ